MKFILFLECLYVNGHASVYASLVFWWKMCIGVGICKQEACEWPSGQA
jgi:hypothetical protein